MTFGDFSGEAAKQSNNEFGGRQSQSPVYNQGPKRWLDIALVLISLPITLPLLLILIVIVAIDGGSPLYRQKRLGRGGLVFKMVKIRTMVPKADDLLELHLQKDPAARQEWDETQKLKRDPRVTLIGRFLRKSSLDELPQLWNVLKGEMSLVGPRPMMVEQRAIYPGTAYFELRPGITGLWQVSERNQTSFADRAVYDRNYLISLSFSLDLSILFRTLFVVFRGTGC